MHFNYSTPVAQKPCKKITITAGSNKAIAECYCPETNRMVASLVRPVTKWRCRDPMELSISRISYPFLIIAPADA